MEEEVKRLWVASSAMHDNIERCTDQMGQPCLQLQRAMPDMQEVEQRFGTKEDSCNVSATVDNHADGSAEG